MKKIQINTVKLTNIIVRRKKKISRKTEIYQKVKMMSVRRRMIMMRQGYNQQRTA